MKAQPLKTHPTPPGAAPCPPAAAVAGGRVPALTLYGCATTTSEPSLAAAAVSAPAEDAWLPGRAILRAHRDGAVYGSKAGGDWQRLDLGARLSEGAKVKCDDTATGDFFLGANGPVIRLTPGSVVGFERMRFQTNQLGEVVETVIKLETGRLLGAVKTLQPQSKYEIILPASVCAIRGGGQFDVSASGRVTVVEGTVTVTCGAGCTFSVVAAPRANEKGAEALRRAMTR